MILWSSTHTDSNGLGFYKCILRGRFEVIWKIEMIWSAASRHFFVVPNLVECPEYVSLVVIQLETISIDNIQYSSCQMKVKMMTWRFLFDSFRFLFPTRSLNDLKIIHWQGLVEIDCLVEIKKWGRIRLFKIEGMDQNKYQNTKD